jgi:peptide/nickel transport system permease protein
MVIEGGLSFLGFGIQAPQPTWGNMIAQGQQSLLTKPSLVVFPSVVLFVTVLSCNLLGEALRARWGAR